MAHHIACEAQQKGLEANIAFLTQGFTTKIKRLESELVTLRREEDNQLTAHAFQEQQLRKASLKKHEDEIASLRKELRSVIETEAEKFREFQARINEAEAAMKVQKSAQRSGKVRLDKDLEEAQQALASANKKHEASVAKIRDDYSKRLKLNLDALQNKNTAFAEVQEQLRQLQAEQEQTKVRLSGISSSNDAATLRKLEDEVELRFVERLQKAEEKIAEVGFQHAQEIRAQKRKYHDLEQEHQRCLSDVAMQPLLVHLRSSSFQTTATHAIRRADSSITLASKLHRAVTNLPLAEVALGVKCREHIGAYRRVSDLGTTLGSVGVEDEEIIHYCRQGKAMKGKSVECTEKHSPKALGSADTSLKGA